jgi:hypothetical protein
MNRTSPLVRAKTGPLAVSLQTILVAVFYCACLSRLIAHFGSGVAAILCWAFALGAAVGGLTVVIGATFRTFSSATTLHHERWLDFGADAVLSVCTGAVTGLLAGWLGFAAATVGPIQRIRLHGFWF